MNCEITIDPADNTAFIRRFSRNAAERHVPLNGSLALTHRCNLGCSICYLQGQDRVDIDSIVALRLIDEMAEAGCLVLVITGGEPLLHPDFHRIYRSAKMRGLLVIVFSNGTLIDDAVAGLFEELPPRAVDVTLYGATAATYETITGVPGSYAACRRGLDTLAKHAVPFRLKTMVTTGNSHEFTAMEALASQYGVRFRYDAALFPALNGNQRPLTHRIAPEAVVGLDFGDAERAADWSDQLARVDPDIPLSRLYACGAGVTAFHLDPAGRMQPCVMVRSISADAAGMGFAQAWQAVSADIANRTVAAGFTCRTCPRKVLCGYCPGFFELEQGSETVPSEYLCSIGHQRWEILHREKTA